MPLFDIIVWGLVASGIALLGRAMPWPARWLRVKPLACNTCLGFHGAWMALLLRGQWDGWVTLVWTYFAIGAIAVLIVNRIFPAEIELPLPE